MEAVTAQTIANQNYAAVLSGDGTVLFNTNNPTYAATFHLDNDGHLLFNGLYAQVPVSITGGVTEVQFLNPATDLCQPPADGADTFPLVCVNTLANGLGGVPTSTLTCSADGGTFYLAQVCANIFYLGDGVPCNSLIINTIDASPGAGAPTTAGVGPGTDPLTGGFTLKYNGNYLITVDYYGTTRLAFEGTDTAIFFALDTDGRLHSYGTTGADPGLTVVTDAGFFTRAELLVAGPDVIPNDMVPILCSIHPVTGFLSCKDGELGSNSILQVCNGDTLFAESPGANNYCTTLETAPNYDPVT